MPLRSPARARSDGHERSVRLFPHATLKISCWSSPTRSAVAEQTGKSIITRQPADFNVLASNNDFRRNNASVTKTQPGENGSRHPSRMPQRFRLVGGTELSFTPADETTKPALLLCMEPRTQRVKRHRP